MFTFAAGLPIAGRYLLTERLYVGPAGTTLWAAIDDVLGRPVVIKFFTKSASLDPARARLHARARSLARLSHPNLVPVLDFGDVSTGDDCGRIPYTVLAYAEGTPLAVRIASAPLSWQASAGMLADVAGALAVLHQRGLTHGFLDGRAVLLNGSITTVVGLVPAACGSPGDPDLLLGTRASDLAAVAQLTQQAMAPAELAAAPAEFRQLLAPGVVVDAAELAARARRLVTQGPPPRHGSVARRRVLPVAALAAGGLAIAAAGGALGFGEQLLPPDWRRTGLSGEPRAPDASGTAGPGHLDRPRTASQSPTTPASPGPQPHPTPSGAVDGSPAPVEPTAGTDDFPAVIAALHVIVSEGHQAGEIADNAAAQLHSEVDELAAAPANAAAQVRRIENQLYGWERAGKVTPQRAELIREELRRVEI